MPKIENLNLIYQKYNPTKERCRASVNPEIYIQDNDNLEIACMIAGFKNLYFTRWPEIINELDPLLKQLINKLNFKTIQYFQYYLSKPVKENKKTVMMPAFFKEQMALIYTTKGKKNALLFYKKDLELNIKEFQEPGSWPETINPYLIGLLLEYDLADIEFFYIVDGFALYKEKEPEITEKHFTQWSEKNKKEFIEFKENIWPNSKPFKIYQDDKVQANKWLEQNSKLNIEQLEDQIVHLQATLKSLLREYKK